jgi:hypothetical protein
MYVGGLLIMLYADAIIPPGHADGLTYSMKTRELCLALIA